MTAPARLELAPGAIHLPGFLDRAGQDALLAAIRGAELVTFTTAGHGLYIDERDKFNAEPLAFAAG